MQVGLLLLLILFTSYSLWSGTKIYSAVQNKNEMVAQTTPYSQKGNGGESWLIVGDSLTYGVGATDQDSSIAGQIGANRPNDAIVNASTVGAKTKDIKGIIQAELALNKYDFIVVAVGGNDVVRIRSDMEAVVNELHDLIKFLGAIESQSVLVTLSAPENISVIPKPLLPLAKSRFDKLHSVASESTTSLNNVSYVDMSNPNIASYKSFEASDGFHLNDLGYSELTKVILRHAET